MMTSFLAATKPDILQKASVGIIEQKMCGALYNFSLTDRMLCAGFLEGRVDSCQVGAIGMPLPHSYLGSIPGTEKGKTRMFDGRAVVAHTFNPSTWEAEAGKSLSLRPARSTE